MRDPYERDEKSLRTGAAVAPRANVLSLISWATVTSSKTGACSNNSCTTHHRPAPS